MKTHLTADRLDHPTQLSVWVVACLSLVCVFSGCEEEAVRSYQAPKSPAYTPPAPMGPVTGSGSAAPSDINWDLPEGWQTSTTGLSMAMAIFDVVGNSAEGEVGEAARVTVTELSGEAGGFLGNVNRWRGQVGLAPVEKIELQPISPVQIDGHPAGLIDLAAAPGVTPGIPRMLVVLLPRIETNSTWFFKMTGPDDVVSQHKQNFIGFVESVRFGEAADE